jgi:ectoine hydroxylase-related dioxygenase (phytanoyl-CoA dioxygenase family)
LRFETSRPVFEEILMNERMLALSSYLLGQSFLLSSMICHGRGPKNAHLALHADTPGPQPYPAQCVMANCNIALVDYKKETGCLAIVPRTHELCRPPSGSETDIYNNPFAQAIEVPAGSMILYHGNAWHGAYRREVPGVRMNLAMPFVRNHLSTQELIRESVTPEMLERNNERFAMLCGQYLFNGWRKEGPDLGRDPARAAALGKAMSDWRFG